MGKLKKVRGKWQYEKKETKKPKLQTIEKKIEFRGQPIEDYPPLYQELIEFAKKGPHKTPCGMFGKNEKYPEIGWDLPGYYLAIYLGEYFSNEDPAIEELKQILYEKNTEEKENKKRTSGWLQWYFPRMIRPVKNISMYLRGFEIGLPGSLCCTKKHGFNALAALKYCIEQETLGDASIIFYKGQTDTLKRIIEEIHYKGILESRCRLIKPSRPALNWNPIIEEYTRKGLAAYKKNGLRGYINFKCEMLADNSTYPRAEIDESRILPLELLGKIEIWEPSNYMFRSTFPKLEDPGKANQAA